MSKVIDYEYDYFGLWSPGGICRVRTYTQEGQLLFVVLTELEKNRSASVTNMAECIAAEIAERTHSCGSQRAPLNLRFF